MAIPRLLIPEIATVRLTENWHVAKDGDPAAVALYERHYSAHRYRDGRVRKLIVGPGEKIVLLTRACDALFVWRRFRESGETEPKGINCAIFRNEGPALSSDLILQAERVAWCRWPGERLYTYVGNDLPGFCFLAARWKRCGTTGGGLLVLEKMPAGVPRTRGKREATTSP